MTRDSGAGRAPVVVTDGGQLSDAVAVLKAQIGCSTEVGEAVIRMTAADLGDSVENVAAFVEHFGQLP